MTSFENFLNNSDSLSGKRAAPYFKWVSARDLNGNVFFKKFSHYWTYQEFILECKDPCAILFLQNSKSLELIGVPIQHLVELTFNFNSATEKKCPSKAKPNDAISTPKSPKLPKSSKSILPKGKSSPKK